MVWFSWPWSHKRPANRKYIDLIYDETSLWASYMPFKATPPRAGDFGYVEKETGDFVYRGNIYEDKDVMTHMPELKEEKYQPTAGQVIKKWIITARTARHIDAEFAPTGSFAGVAEATIDVEVSFHPQQRGAFLMMYGPCTLELPKDVLLERLSKVSKLRERGIYLVTKVITCPAYALQLSNRDASSVRVKFVGQLPIPAAPGVTAGATASFGWRSERVGSSYQEACHELGEYAYCPLFSLKQVRPTFKPLSGIRRSEQVRRGDDTWMDIIPPWAALDDDGNEIPYDDEEEDTSAKPSGMGAYLPKAGIAAAVGVCAVGAALAAKAYGGV